MRREGQPHPALLHGRSPDTRPDPAGSAAISLSDAHDMLCQWGAAGGQRSGGWVSGACPGYDDYEPPRDPDTRQDREIRRAERDDAPIDRVGWCVTAGGAPHTQILRQSATSQSTSSPTSAGTRPYGRSGRTFTDLVGAAGRADEPTCKPIHAWYRMQLLIFGSLCVGKSRPKQARPLRRVLCPQMPGTPTIDDADHLRRGSSRLCCRHIGILVGGGREFASGHRGRRVPRRHVPAPDRRPGARHLAGRAGDAPGLLG